MARKPKTPKQVETLKHEQAKRKNIPTAELQSAAQRAEELQPIEPVTYQRRYPLAYGEERSRDKDIDPQIIWKGTKIRLTPEQIEQLTQSGEIDIGEAHLVWRGKDQQDWSDLVVQAPPLYIQEKVHPKAIIDDLTRRTKENRESEADMADLFYDFNGIDPEAKTEFYQHDQNWSNRFILGDSLQVMASLAEREGLRGQVQCIYFDPPYGIKFNSNWQVSTRSRDVKDGRMEEISREPEQVRAFRDTWKDGIHSYLAYLRDRMTSMRDLLTESGSIFVQIGDENVHRVRALMDEVFAEENFVSQIVYNKTTGFPSGSISNVADTIIWYAKNKKSAKFRKLGRPKQPGEAGATKYRPASTYSNLEGMLVDPEEFVDLGDATSSDEASNDDSFEFRGLTLQSGRGLHFKSNPTGMRRVDQASRLAPMGKGVRYVRKLSDFGYSEYPNIWNDIGGIQSRTDPKVYVVQTALEAIKRCVLMTSDPGDLVLDPTCGSGSTAMVAEQWGRRWITIDTSRVALALARARIMGAKYPYYLLADSSDGHQKEGELSGKPPADRPVHGDVRQGFVYERAPHIMLEVIAKNAEIDVIWEDYQEKLEPLRSDLNAALNKHWEEWEIPREASDEWPESAKTVHAAWWEQRIARQEAIDKSIAQKANVELLYDRPYEDKSRVRVAGPFTVESLSPHRVVPADELELIEDIEAAEGKRKPKLPKGVGELNDFTDMILEHLKSSGVQQARKADKITFESIAGWPGDWIAADGRFVEGESERRAAIFIGPEFGTISRADLTAAAREALDARFDVLIACGFAFEAHTSELNKLGPLPILKAKMNPELHMSDELKNTGAGNLFVVFGEPDIKWDFDDDGEIVVEVLGVDVFDPKTGEVRASGKDDIAAWFIDTDYNEESFFVRHAYFMGANDPYKSLKTALKAEIDAEAWATLYRDTSRPFPRPDTGRFAVKVINHFGDEVMKVFAV